MTQTSPYEGLPSRNFWRSGVAEPLRRSNKVENVWTPKFEIKSSDRIITVGSCFAQHIGAQLDKLGFHRLQYGLSPSRLLKYFPDRVNKLGFESL